jgi:hypothetical protein
MGKGALDGRRNVIIGLMMLQQSIFPQCLNKHAHDGILVLAHGL